jgi:hypothetical protein
MLVLLFLSAILLVNVTIYAAIIFAVRFFSDKIDPSHWRPEIFLLVTGATSAIVGAGSLYMRYQLREGGIGVALLLGGDLIMEKPLRCARKKIA